MEHVNDIVRSTCNGVAMSNVLDVGKKNYAELFVIFASNEIYTLSADENNEFGDFVFFDMPGWQSVSRQTLEHI